MTGNYNPWISVPGMTNFNCCNQRCCNEVSWFHSLFTLISPRSTMKSMESEVLLERTTWSIHSKKSSLNIENQWRARFSQSEQTINHPTPDCCVLLIDLYGSPWCHVKPGINAENPTPCTCCKLFGSYWVQGLVLQICQTAPLILQVGWSAWKCPRYRRLVSS